MHRCIPAPPDPNALYALFFVFMRRTPSLLLFYFILKCWCTLTPQFDARTAQYMYYTVHPIFGLPMRRVTISYQMRI